MSGFYTNIFRYRAWVILGLLVLLVGIVRIRLRDMPLERDEGEYAYTGQLLLQGIPPYKLAYNMKFPGIYGAYAVVMLVFGQTTAGIHLGLLVVNVASLLLLFLLVRKLLDVNGGLVAAVVFAIVSLSISVLGLAAHASHFVILAVLGGTLLLLRAVETARPGLCFASGALFGLAFLLKQPGVFWGVFGLIYLSSSEPGRLRQPEPRTGPRLPARSPWKNRLIRCAWYSLGMSAPFLLMCLALWWAGVFDRFLFWTFTYAREYVSVHPLFKASAEDLRSKLGEVFGPNAFFWAVAALGMVVMWWEERLRNRRVFIAGFVIFSLMAVCPGWYFRQHYFVFLLPAASLLIAIAINRSVHLLRQDRTIELFLAIPILGLFVTGIALALIGNGSVWFELSPVAACRESYVGQLFPEEVELGEYIKARSAPGARIAVLGSEPQVFFYSRRHSATGYIYIYPLMEQHKYAPKMQEEMIREIEAAQPEFLIFVELQESWLARPEPARQIRSWYEQYSKANYELVKIFKGPADDTPGEEVGARRRGPGLLLVFQRKHP